MDKKMVIWYSNFLNEKSIKKEFNSSKEIEIEIEKILNEWFNHPMFKIHCRKLKNPQQYLTEIYELTKCHLL